MAKAAGAKATKDYLLRDVEADKPGLWARVKVRAARDEKPIRSVIVELLDKYAAGKVAL